MAFPRAHDVTHAAPGPHSTTSGLADVARALTRLVPAPVVYGWRALSFFLTSSSD